MFSKVSAHLHVFWVISRNVTQSHVFSYIFNVFSVFIHFEPFTMFLGVFIKHGSIPMFLRTSVTLRFSGSFCDFNALSMHFAVVVLWICLSPVRRQEHGESPQSKDDKKTAIISKCHWHAQSNYSRNSPGGVTKLVFSDFEDLQN